MIRSKVISGLLALAALLFAASAQAQFGSAPPPAPPETFDIVNYGAACNGTTDDAAAINLATAAARTADLTGKTVKITGPFNKRCKILSSIDMTRFTNSPVIWDVPQILCSTNGTPCVDATGSKFVHWVSLTMFGTNTLTPSIGLQVARTVSASGNEHLGDHIWIQGFYTFAAMYVEASEVNVWNHVVVLNQQVDANSYGLVMDGADHWNIQSAFTTVGFSPDVQRSFNDNTFVGGSFQHVGGGVPIWTGTTTGHRYIGSYVEAVGGAACVQLFDNGHGSNLDIRFDHLHCEFSPVQDVFLLTGSNAAPVLKGLLFNDYSPQAANSIFKLDTGVTAPVLQNPTIRIEQTQGGINPKLFDNASAWTINGGTIWLPSDAFWSGSPALFTGCLGTPTGNGCSPTNPVPPGNMIVNGDMAIDQQNAGNKQSTSRYVDRFITDFRGGITIQTAGQRVTSSPPPGYFYSLQMTAGVGIAPPSAAQASNVRHFIEGTSFAGALWGTASAAPLTCGFWAKSTEVGNFPFAVTNSASARSYVATYDLPTANTWAYRVITIPGDTTGSWAGSVNNIAAVLFFNMAAGSNFQTTAGSWQAGLFFTTASAVQFATVASATFNFSGLHCNFGVADLGYARLPYSLELARTERQYTKSILQGTAVAQNAGPAGAVGVQLPYGQAIFAETSFQIKFPVDMYLNNGSTLPTIAFQSPSSASANCYNQTQARDSGAASASNVGSNGFLLTCALVPGDALGDTLAVHYTAATTF